MRLKSLNFSAKRKIVQLNFPSTENNLNIILTNMCDFTEYSTFNWIII